MVLAGGCFYGLCSDVKRQSEGGFGSWGNIDKRKKSIHFRIRGGFIKAISTRCGGGLRTLAMARAKAKRLVLLRAYLLIFKILSRYWLTCPVDQKIRVNSPHQEIFISMPPTPALMNLLQ